MLSSNFQDTFQVEMLLVKIYNIELETQLWTLWSAIEIL